MSAARAVLELHDLDLILELARDDAVRARLGRMGFTFEGLPSLERERGRLLGGIDRRWATSAAPPSGEGSLHLCESCGRLLYWR
jgi:hypothetical protein